MKSKLQHISLNQIDSKILLSLQAFSLAAWLHIVYIKKHTLTDFLSILSMVMFLHIRPQPIFWDFDIKMHGKDNIWCLYQFRWFWSLFFINRKQSPGGAWVGKFKKILQKLWYLHYLTTFRGGLGIKISGTTQGLWNSCSFALKFDYVSIKYKKLQKIKLFLLHLSIFLVFSTFKEF